MIRFGNFFLFLLGDDFVRIFGEDVPTGGVIIIDAVRTRTEREKLADRFGGHVSPEVFDALIRDTEERQDVHKEVVVLFYDIYGFITFSEGRGPLEVL